MTHNTTEQRTTPQLEEKCHSIPLHGKKCHRTMHNAAANAVAWCAMQLHAVAAGRMTAAMAMSTAMQWQCQRWHQTTATQFDSPLPQKSLIKPDYFCIFNCHRFFPFWKVSSVLAPARLFRVSWCHRCPRCLKLVDCFVKVLLLGPSLQIGYA